jgi:hypothetical protein
VDLNTANDLVTGAPGTITLGGRLFLVGQPTTQDFVALRRHLHSLAVKKAKPPLAAIAEELSKLPAHLQSEAIKAAVAQQASGPQVTNEAITEQLYTPEGCAFWTWLLIYKNHKDVRFEEVKAWVSEENVNEVLASLLKASSLEAIAPN